MRPSDKAEHVRVIFEALNEREASDTNLCIDMAHNEKLFRDEGFFNLYKEYLSRQ